jgi:hypothetical protein
MATMLSGAAVMDAALLLIAGNEPCPQPQTSEHLAAIEIMKLKHIIVLQNKVDLITEAAASEQYKSILSFVKGTLFICPSPSLLPSAHCLFSVVFFFFFFFLRGGIDQVPSLILHRSSRSLLNCGTTSTPSTNTLSRKFLCPCATSVPILD